MLIFDIYSSIANFQFNNMLHAMKADTYMQTMYNRLFLLTSWAKFFLKFRTNKMTDVFVQVKLQGL